MISPICCKCDASHFRDFWPEDAHANYQHPRIFTGRIFTHAFSLDIPRISTIHWFISNFLKPKKNAHTKKLCRFLILEFNLIMDKFKALRASRVWIVIIKWWINVPSTTNIHQTPLWNIFDDLFQNNLTYLRIKCEFWIEVYLVFIQASHIEGDEENLDFQKIIDVDLEWIIELKSRISKNLWSGTIQLSIQIIKCQI